MKEIDEIMAEVKTENFDQQRHFQSVLQSSYDDPTVVPFPRSVNGLNSHAIESIWRKYSLAAKSMAIAVTCTIFAVVVWTNGQVFHDDATTYLLLFFVMLGSMVLVFCIEQIERKIGGWRLRYHREFPILSRLGFEYQSALIDQTGKSTEFDKDI